MQALIVISISVLYDEYIILLQQVSHNLNSIQKAVTQECIQQLSSHNSLTQTTWTENPLSTSLSQLQKLKRDTEHNECQRRKWQNIIQNNYACTAKTMTTSLRTANFCLLYDLVINVVTAETVKKQQKKRRTQKRVAFSRSHSWECMRCDKSWKKFEKQMNSVLFTMSTLINKKSYAHTLYNTECLFYEIITSCFAKITIYSAWR
jgi:hypothetical protein